jgi:hypothetical protein
MSTQNNLIIITGSAKQHKAHIIIFCLFIYLFISEHRCPTALSYIETCQNFNGQDFKHHVNKACGPYKTYNPKYGAFYIYIIAQTHFNTFLLYFNVYYMIRSEEVYFVILLFHASQP